MPLSPPAEPLRRLAPLLPHTERYCAWARAVAVTVASLLAGSNALIWWLGEVPPFVQESGLMVMRVNTAVGILAAALALACSGRAPGCWRRLLAQGLASVPIIIGALTAMEDLAGIDAGIDQLLASGQLAGDLGGSMVIHPGRMSLNAALCLVFLGMALLSLDWTVSVGRRRIAVAPGLAIVAALPVSLALVGYLLGLRKFTGLLQSTYILLHTAVALFALCLGVLAARPQYRPMSRIFSIGADGILLRWTLPGTAALLLMLGWLIGRGRETGLVLPGEGAALMLYGGLVLLSGLLIAASRAIGSQEKRAMANAEALQHSEARSRAIIDTALDAVVLMDMSGMIEGWNPAAERIFGWERREVIGRPLAECIIPEELREAHNRGLARLRETGVGPILGKRLELVAIRRDGHRFPIELSVNLLPGTDQTYFVGFIRDITDRTAAEERLRTAKETAESASRAKDNFVATLSHELRTPLTPVLLSAASLRGDERLPDDVRTQMAMIERNVALEARLIDDLLDLTRITRGKFQLRSESCDTHSLLAHALDIVRDDARAKNIGLELELGAQRFGIHGDPARLQQVFWNLLKNAVKFSSAGGRIAVRTHNDAEGNRLLIEVTDTGLGFTPDAAERIFEPFEQEGRGNDHRLGGLGLGLAIARAIVDLHGGVIRAGSAGSGQGATFTVELPGATWPPPGMLAADIPEHAGAHSSDARRILLVEDHEPTLEVLSRLLQRAGHKVISANSIASGRQVAAKEEFDMLISDLGLPDGTGLELIAALRADRPNLQAIALSGYGMEDDLRRTREAGFAAHLVKPVDFDQLRAALRKLNVEA